MRKRSLMVLSVILVLAFVLASCGGAAASSAPPAASTPASTAAASSEADSSGDGVAAVDHEPFSVDIYSWSTGSFTYVIGMAWAELINKYSPWLTAVCVEAPSNLANELMMYDAHDKRENTVYYAVGDAAYRGVEEFEGKQNTRSKMVANFGLTINGLVTCDPNIKTIDDLSGKTMLVRAPMSALNLYWQTIFSELNPEVKFEPMDMTQSVEALLGNRAATFFLPSFAMDDTFTTWAPNAAGAELLSRATTVNFINSPAEAINKLRNEPGGRYENYWTCAVTVPALAVDPRQTEPWDVFMNNGAFFADEDMDDEVVYEMVRVVAEHYKDLSDYHPQAGLVNPETLAIYAGPVDMHPGALKCFDDFGVTPIAMDVYAADFISKAV